MNNDLRNNSFSEKEKITNFRPRFQKKLAKNYIK